jgi:alkylation response protein AidB-like acyl-CoA dehydrogenase
MEWQSWTEVRGMERRPMDVRLSAEQRALRDSAAQVVDALAPRTVRDLDDAGRTAKLDAAVDATGWRELRAAVDGGAPLASAVEAALIAEELGRGLADTPFLGPTLAAELRRLAAAPPATSPETVALVADLSAPAGTVAGASRAVAIDARGASSALVLVPAPGGHLVAAVVLPDASATVDLTRPVAVVDAAAAVPLARQGRPVSAADLDRWTALGLALACADLVGVMRGAVRLACDYAGVRRQFGVAIGSFQAVAHRLADAFVSMEGSRSIALHAAWAVDESPAGDALAAAAAAKAYCARAGRAVCEAAIQVHGGIGNTWECLAHVYLRRALLSGDVLGGAGANLARLLAYHGIGSGHGLR